MDLIWLSAAKVNALVASAPVTFKSVLVIFVLYWDAVRVLTLAASVMWSTLTMEARVPAASAEVTPVTVKSTSPKLLTLPESKGLAAAVNVE